MASPAAVSLGSPEGDPTPGGELYSLMEARIGLIKFLETCTTLRTVPEIALAAGEVLNFLQGKDLLR